MVKTVHFEERINEMKKYLIVIMLFALGLSACSSGKTAVPTEAPEAETTAIPADPVLPTEISEEKTVPAAETAADEGSGTAVQQAEAAISELDAVGERMMDSAAYIVLDTAGKSEWKVPLAGVEFQVPDFIKDAHGGIRAIGGQEIIPGTGIVGMDIVYLSMTEAEYYDLAKKLAVYADDTENIDETFGISTRYMETSHELNKRRHPLFSIIGIGNHQGADEILAAEKKSYAEYGFAEEESADQRIFTQIGAAEDYNFFFVQNPLDEEHLVKAAADGEQYKAEYESLFNSKDQIIPNFTFSRPVGISELVEEGTGLNFETLDIQGNSIKSEDIFRNHKATMLNIWATTCTACISEMPELMRMNKEFEQKGGQIVGLVFDAVEDDLITEAKEIAVDLNIDFLTLLPNDYLRQTFDAMSYPTNYFLNEKGEIIGEPLMGARPSACRDRMSEYLDQ